MKRWFSVFLGMVLCAALLTLPGSAAAKAPQVKEIRVYDVKTHVLIDRYTYTYNSKGQLTGALHENVLDDYAYEFRSSYDKKGNLSKYAMNLPGEKAEQGYLFTHTYNKKNQITSTNYKLVENPDAKKPYVLDESTAYYRYDADGTLLRVVHDQACYTNLYNYVYEDAYLHYTSIYVDGELEPGEETYMDEYQRSVFTGYGPILLLDDEILAVSTTDFVNLRMLDGLGPAIYVGNSRMSEDSSGRLTYVEDEYCAIEITYS